MSVKSSSLNQELQSVKPFVPLNDKEGNLELHKRNQAEFNELFISSRQICDILNIPRPTMMNGRRTMLPPHLSIKGIKGYMWNRAHALPFIEAWQLSLNRRQATKDSRINQSS